MRIVSVETIEDSPTALQMVIVIEEVKDLNLLRLELKDPLVRILIQKGWLDDKGDALMEIHVAHCKEPVGQGEQTFRVTAIHHLPTDPRCNCKG